MIKQIKLSRKNWETNIWLSIKYYDLFLSDYKQSRIKLIGTTIEVIL